MDDIITPKWISDMYNQTYPCHKLISDEIISISFEISCSISEMYWISNNPNNNNNDRFSLENEIKIPEGQRPNSLSLGKSNMLVILKTQYSRLWLHNRTIYGKSIQRGIQTPKTEHIQCDNLS